MQDLFWLPMCFYLCANALTVRISRKRFGHTLLLTMLLPTLLMFFSQLFFNTFFPAKIAFVLMAIAGGIVLIVGSKDREFRGRYFTAGFRITVLLLILFMVVDFRRHFSISDELTFWGKAVKEMIRLDRFYCVPGTLLNNHLDYPPMISLMQTLWCGLSGGYSEPAVTMAVHMLMSAAFMPFLLDSDHFGKNDSSRGGFGKQAILLFVVLLILTSLDAFDVFNSIYGDIVLPVVLSGIMLQILDRSFAESKTGRLSICVSFFFFMQTKHSIMIAFAVILWGVCILREKGKKEICTAAD